MFEWDEIATADNYILTIYQKKGREATGFAAKAITHSTSEIAWLATQGLYFGNDYQWAVQAYKKKKLIFTSTRYSFKILQYPQVMADSFKTVVSYSGNPGNGLVFLDRSAMAIDKKGNPVWFLPIPSDSLAKKVIRDLELTASGTVTYLDVNGAYEKNLQGQLLWKAPDDGRISGSKREEYHHEMEKNKDGSYTICGSQFASGIKDGKLSNNSPIKYNTIIQYSADGRIIWSWDEITSLKTDSIFGKNRQFAQGGHLNGFAYAHDRKKIFMSFKNLSEVYLFDIPSHQFITGLNQSHQFNYQQQHGPFLTAQNELIIYNNNIVEKEGASTSASNHPAIMIFKYDTVTNQCALQWQYELRADKYPQGIMGKEGYASELKNGNILVCAGGANYSAEITRKKEKVWDCYFYHRNAKDTSWQPYSNYRCQGSTSLYPLYYTLKYMGIKGGQPIFRLHNDGSESGFFELQFVDRASQKTFQYLSKRLAPGQVELVRLPNDFYQSKGLDCTILPKHVLATPKAYFYNKLK